MFGHEGIAAYAAAVDRGCGQQGFSPRPASQQAFRAWEAGRQGASEGADRACCLRSCRTERPPTLEHDRVEAQRQARGRARVPAE